MTSGNKVYNRTIPVKDPLGNISYAGETRWVSWDGVDQTKPTYTLGVPRRVSIPVPPVSTPIFRTVYSRRRRKWIKIRLNKPSLAEITSRNAALASIRARSLLAKVKRMKPVRAPHNYTKSVESINRNYYYFPNKTGTGWTVTGISNTYGFTDSHCPYDPSQEYKVIDKLRRKVFGSGFHPGIFAAEMPQALRMIASSATRIRLGMLHAVARDWRGIVRNLFPNASNLGPAGLTQKGHPLYREYRAYLSFKEGRTGLSELWLELQYGWFPLLGDLEAGAAFLAEQLNGGSAAISRRVAATRDWSSFEWQKQPSHFWYWARRDTEFQLRYVITNLTAAPVTGMPSLASVAGVAWEKLPYSFVADWVVPISAYLQSLRTASDLKGTVVRSLKRTTRWSHPTFGNTGNSRVPGAPLAQTGEHRWLMNFSRTCTSEINPPVPVEDLSLSSIFHSWERTTNAVALLKDLRIDPNDRVGAKKLLGQLSLGTNRSRYSE